MSQTPYPPFGGSGSPGPRTSGSSSAAVREPSDPSAKILSQPIRRRSTRVGAERPPAAEALARRRVELLRADAGVDAHRELARRRQRPVRLDRAAQAVLEREAAGIVGGHDAERDELRG